MSPSKSAIARIAFAFLLGTLGLGAAASAATFTVYVDADNNTATGCTSGSFSGIEHILITTVDATPQVTALLQQTCTGGILGAPTALTPPPPSWPVGTAAPPNGPSIVETYLPFTPIAPIIRFYVTSDSDATPPVSDSLTATLSGGPIIFALPFDPAIPTLGEWGLIVLAFGLAAAAMVVLRRRQRVAFLLLCLLACGATAAWAAIVLDGQIDDWEDDQPLATDPFGSDPSPDLRAFFARFEAGRLVFRIDTSLNDPPVVTATAGSTNFVEDGGPVVIDSGGTVSDPNDITLTSATVTITNPQDGAAETLAATNCPGLTVTPGLNSLSITGSQPLAVYQACLQSATYNNASQNPGTTPRIISFVVSDGSSTSAPGNRTVTVTPVNDAPVVTTTAGNTAFTEGAGPVVVDSGVTVTDVDDTNLESATVSLVAAPDGGAETLNATSCAGLTVTPGNPLTITGSQPVATYQTCLQSVTYNNTSLNPNTANRTVNFVANDGDANSNTAPKTVAVAPSPNAPTITTTAGTTAFTEDGGPVVVDGGVTVTDPDDTNLESATVSLAAAPDGGAEVLNATVCAGLTVTPGNPLTITGSQPVATYQTCLQSVTYNNTDPDPDTSNRTVNFVANDGDNNSNTATKTVTIAADNDPPVVTTTAGSTAFTEDGGPVVVDAGVTVTDADDANLESATVSLASAPDGGAEVLNATSCAGLTVTPGNPLTITGSQPVATYQTCLQSVTYNNTDQNPDPADRTVNFVVNDGDDNSNTATKTVTINVQADAPVVTTTAGTTVFTEDGGPVVVDSGVTVTDADDANLESATISLAAAPDGGAEVLNATSCAGLTVTPGNPLTITGSQPIATYQTCLQSVTYNNTDQDPDTTNRTVNFVVNDGDNNSNTATKTVSISAQADAPVVTTTAGTTAFTEDGGPVVVDSGVTVTDADDVNLESATISLASAPDGAAEVLNATSCVGLTVTPGNPLTITGSQPIANYQTCLQSVNYNNTDQNPDTTNRTVNFVVNDGDNNSNTASKTVSVAALNDAPVVTTTAGTTAFAEDGGPVVVDGGVTVTDVDDVNLESATVSLTAASDGAAETLNATSCAGLTVTPGNPLTITGSQPLATYQTCLQSVTYNNTSQNPTASNRTVNFVVNDGDVNSNTASKTVSVAAVNDAPVVTTTAGTTAFVEDGGPVVVDAGVTVTDVDDTNLDSATVSLAAAPDGVAEVLNATACVGLTVTPGNPLTITGSQPLATYQTCLQSVTYNNTSQNPNTTNRTVNFVVNDGDVNSNTAPKTVSVAAANDAPVVTTTAGTTAFTEDGGPVVVDGGVTVTDADDVNLNSATVSLTAAPDGAAETLSATSCAGLTVTPGNPLTITGVQPVAAYQTCLQSVTYNNTSQNPNTANRTVNFVVNDGDVNSNTAPKTVSVTSVNDAPVVTTTAGISAFTEDGGPVVVDSGVTVTDVDDTNLNTATVSLLAAPDGAAESLNATACAGLTVTPGNPLTITGVQPLATYQTCLQSVTYNNTSQNPNTTNRTVNFVVNDGDVNSNTAPKTVSVTAVNDAPAITTSPVSYSTAGNTQLHVEGKVLAGVVNTSDPTGVDTKAGPFTDPDGPVAPAIVDASGATTNGGSYDIDPNGSFTYVPPVGFTGTDSFTYQVTDTLASTVGTVNITVSQMIWYVHDVTGPNNPAAGDDGRSTNPFEVLTDVEGVVTDDDFIFVFEGNTGTTPHLGTLDIDNTGVKLHGQGIGLTVPGFGTLVPAGNKPRINNPGAAGAPEDNGVNVVATAASLTGVEIRGLDISGRDNAVDVTATGANNAGVRISENAISNDPANGLEGVDVNGNGTGTVTVAVHDNTATTRGTAFDITRTTGTLVVTALDDNVVSGDTGGAGIVVTGPATLDATPGGGLDPVSGGVTVIGASGNRIGGAGIVLGSVTGALDFTDLDVFAGTAGVTIGGTGAFTGAAGTRVTVPNGVSIVEAGNGPGVDASNATIDLRLTTLTVSASPTTGVSLVNVSDATVAPTDAHFSAGSGSTIAGATGTDFNVDGGNATVSYAGSITNTAGRSVAVQNRTGDSVTFTSTSTINDTGTGILVNANAAGAVTDFLGTLTQSTGANAAFTATSGGTLRVMGSANTISATTGVALNVTNTTIGTGSGAPETGLRFRSISAGTGAAGPSSGIVLNNTGALGSLTVTGTGGGNSGGTIRNTTSHGISLTSTLSPSFTSVRIQDTGGSGIEGTQVTNFTFTNGSIDNSATAGGADDSNIAFNTQLVGTENNISGTVTITNNSLTNSFWHGVDILNFNGTLSDVNISSNMLTSSTSTATSKGAAIRLNTFGSTTTAANVTRATIANNVISNFPSGAGIQAQGGNSNAAGPSGTYGIPGSATDIIAITGNRVAGASAANRLGTSAITGTCNGKGQCNFNISNNGTVANPLTNIAGTVIGCAGSGNTTSTFTVNSNVIVANNTVASNGIGGGTGTTFGTTDTPNMTWTINNNNISATDGNGILAVARGATGTLRVKIQNNTVAAPLTGVRQGIRVDAGNAASVDDSVCLNISGNTTAGSGNTSGIGLRKQGTTSTTNDFAVNGMVATSSPGVEQFVGNGAGLNPGTANGVGDGSINGVLLISAASGFSNCSFP